MLWFKLDVAENMALGFQDAGSIVMEEIINFHNFVMIYLVFVVVAVMWVLFQTLSFYKLMVCQVLV